MGTEKTQTNDFRTIAFDINSGQVLPLVYFDKYKDKDVDTKTITFNRLMYLTVNVDLDITKSDFIKVTKIPEEHKELAKDYIKNRIQVLKTRKRDQELFDVIVDKSVLKNLGDNYDE